MDELGVILVAMVTDCCYVHHHKVLLFNYDIYCKTTLVPKDVLKNS
jgi:hypothetical protein